MLLGSNQLKNTTSYSLDFLSLSLHCSALSSILYPFYSYSSLLSWRRSDVGKFLIQWKEELEGVIHLFVCLLVWSFIRPEGQLFICVFCVSAV